MKKYLALCLIMGMCSMVSANLVSNGDFAQGWTSWTAENFTKVAWGSLVNNSMAIRPSFTWGANSWNDILFIQKGSTGSSYGGVYQLIDIQGITNFDLSFKFGYTNIGSFGAITMYYYDTPTHSTGKYFQQRFDWTGTYGVTDPNPTDVVYNNSSAGMLQYSKTGFAKGAAPSGNAGLIIPNEAKYIMLNIRAYNTPYQYMIDDVVITPEPATMAVLGLGGLLVLRKRK